MFRHISRDKYDLISEMVAALISGQSRYSFTFSGV